MIKIPPGTTEVERPVAQNGSASDIDIPPNVNPTPQEPSPLEIGMGVAYFPNKKLTLVSDFNYYTADFCFYCLLKLSALGILPLELNTILMIA